MTLRRAVLYVGGASLLIAWFSSAASVSWQQTDGAAAVAGPAESSRPALAADIQEQAKRLRERLAAAPPPQRPFRNPFSFRAAEPVPREDPRAVLPAAVPDAPPPPAEPPLTLVGIAESKRAEGMVRTAVITTAAEELIMVAVGDTVIHRYRLTAIGHDTAELTDLSTGQVRRISLQ